MADKLKITINGKDFEVEPGRTILQVALENNIYIPHFCYHPHLKNAGNCRMCLVEVEKSPKLLTACSTPVMDGMIVQTESDIVKSAREGIMEFLLINHPLDCPVCDQAGECELQEYSHKYGTGKSRFVESKNRSTKHKVLGPDVIIDNERCIKCQRCVRFLRDVIGSGEMGYFKRGDHASVGIFDGYEIDNDYSINITDLCPVGALTDRNFRFKKRVWFLRKKPSICNMCGRGCNINFWVNDDFTNDCRIWRITPRENEDVNKFFMCNQGRLQYKDFEEMERVLVPMTNEGGVLKESESAEKLVTYATEKLLEISKKYGKDSVAFVSSPFASNEELFLLKLIANNIFGENSLIVAKGEKWEGDNLLKVVEKSPNSEGVKEIIGKTAKLDMSKIKGLVFFRTDGLGLNIGDDEMGDLEFSLAIESRNTSLLTVCDALLPLRAYYEEEGTYTNVDGIVQRFSVAIDGGEDIGFGWKILAGLAEKLGVKGISYSSSSDVFCELASQIDSFKDMDYGSIGMKGQILGGRK